GAGGARSARRTGARLGRFRSGDASRRGRSLRRPLRRDLDSTRNSLLRGDRVMSARNALFIPGPTNMPEAVRRAIDIPLEDQRAPDFPQFTLGLFRDLRKVFKTSDGQVFLFPGSGTGGWEAALTNTLSPGDRVLAARFGQFSHLWVDMCQR